jgi:hypothetical protein
MKRILFVATAVALVASFLLSAVVLADAAGTVTHRDDKAFSDKITVALTGVPAPAAGRVYVGWLVSDDGKTMTNIGAVAVGADGVVNVSYTSPKGENLIGLYNKLVLTTEAQADAAGAAPKGAIAVQALGAPAEALMHVRHVIYQWDQAPNKVGFGVGTLTQAKLLSQHAHLLQDAVTAGNLVSAKTHAEHIVNIAEGSKGPNFGDGDKNGTVANPGDGFGLLEYAKGAAQHANFAATTPNPGDYVKLHSTHVIDTANNVIGWATAARDGALNVLKAADMAAVTPLVAPLVKNADLALTGNSTRPTKGEGGATTTYEHAQNMGGFIVAAGAAAAGAAHTMPATALPKAGDGSPLGLLALAGVIVMAAGVALRRWGMARTR